jgi:GGDEF domain-containing protein
MIKLLSRSIAELTDTQRQAIILDYTSRRLYRYDLTDYLDLYGVVLLLSFLLMVSLTVSCVLYVRALRLKQEEKIRQMVDYDALTGVLTLAGFRKRVQELLRAHPDTPYMLTFSNIRGFKYLNSSLGKDACDELLRFWARRCQESQSEAEVFGRVGADCFAALIFIPDEEKIRRDERDVLNPVRNYFVDRGKENQVQIASGVYILTQEDYQSADVDRMLDYARIAEKRDQSGLISDYNVYNPALWEKGKRGADIVGHLPLALRSGEIQVWYLFRLLQTFPVSACVFVQCRRLWGNQEEYFFLFLRILQSFFYRRRSIRSVKSRTGEHLLK